MKQQKYHWLPFWKLEREEVFYIGKTCYEKLWFIFAATCVAGHFRMILPWTRVKTTRPFGKIVPNPFPTVIQTFIGKGPTVNIKPARIPTHHENNSY